MINNTTIKQDRKIIKLIETYDNLIKKTYQSNYDNDIEKLITESIKKNDLFIEIMFSSSELSRAEREMLAVVTSVINNCHYCQIRHSQALHNYWKDEERIIRLQNNYYDANLSVKELLLCRFAENLTINPDKFKEPDLIESLKIAKLSDEIILDAALVVSYFNFINRLVLSTGVRIDLNKRIAYK